MGGPGTADPGLCGSRRPGRRCHGTVWAGFSCDFAAALGTTAVGFAKGVRAGHPAVPQQRPASVAWRHVTGLSPRLIRHIRRCGWDVLVFEFVDADHADFSPGSRDLPQVADAFKPPRRPAPANGVPRWPVWQTARAAYLDTTSLALLDGDALVPRSQPAQPAGRRAARHPATGRTPRAARPGSTWPTPCCASWAATPPTRRTGPAKLPCWNAVTEAAADALATAHTRAWRELAGPEDAALCSARVRALAGRSGAADRGRTLPPVTSRVAG
ncbi:hypothetical protein ACU686_23375 [Yinghuangia aomiensis]